MNKSILAVGIIFLSLLALLLINVLTNYSTGSELDYYLVKETTDAAMKDAIDMSYYWNCGMYRIDKEKFVESFLYRFASNIDATRGYKIGFYDINEVPPKVSVKIDSYTTLGFKTDTGSVEAPNITTSYDAILESNYLTDLETEHNLADQNSEACKSLKDKLLNLGTN